MLAALLDEPLVPGPPLVPDPLRPVKVCLSNRLLGNEKVECARMTQMNWARTAARFQQSAVVRYVADTAEVHFNGQDMESQGRLCLKAHPGMFLHPTYADLPNWDPSAIPAG